LGQGLKFDGGDDAIDAGSASSLDDIDYLTVSAWIQPKTPGYSNSGNIIRKGENNSISSWAFGFQQGYLGSLGFSHAFSSTDGFWRIEAIRMNQWAHVVATYDRTSASNNPIFYVNGIATTTIVLSPPAGTASSDAAKVLYLGGIASANRNFDGSLDDVRIYNRILSATEVKQLYKEGQVTVTSFTCGVSTVKDVDGNVYNTLKIGTQCWMKQNMRVGTRINVATAQSNNSIIEKYCYDDNPANCTTNHPNHPDGGLYQWNEAMQYSSTPGAQGICPAGWHIPTHDQFTTLERSVCTSGSCATDFPYDITTTGYRGTTEGTNLKPNGTSLFEGNLAGYSFGGSFYVRGTVGFFWSSLGSGGNAWDRLLFSGLAQVDRDTNVQSYGFSVRCLKN
jgi:uncharacterized protein (TIGR02145 family)